MSNAILRISSAVKSNRPDYGWDVFKRYDDLSQQELLGIYDSCFVHFLRAMIGRKDAARRTAELRYCPVHRRCYVTKSAVVNHQRCSKDQ